MRHLVVPLVLLVGCSLSEARYVDKFVEADCAYLMACTSEPILTFQGWETLEDCMDDRGPEVAALAVSCEFDPKAGRACVKAVEDQACAADGEEREFPAICQDVFTQCSDAEPDTDGDTDSDTGTGM